MPCYSRPYGSHTYSKYSLFSSLDHYIYLQFQLFGWFKNFTNSIQSKFWAPSLNIPCIFPILVIPMVQKWLINRHDIFHTQWLVECVQSESFAPDNRRPTFNDFSVWNFNYQKSCFLQTKSRCNFFGIIVFLWGVCLWNFCFCNRTTMARRDWSVVSGREYWSMYCSRSNGEIVCSNIRITCAHWKPGWKQRLGQSNLSFPFFLCFWDFLVRSSHHGNKKIQQHYCHQKFINNKQNLALNTDTCVAVVQIPINGSEFANAHDEHSKYSFSRTGKNIVELAGSLTTLEN